MAGSGNAQKLANQIVSVTDGSKLIIVSNREPCLHEYTDDGIRAVRPASGLVSALESIVTAVGGTWIAHGSGSADRKVVDKQNKIGMPEENPQYTLKRVWMNRKEEEGYYYGLSNRALWPLSHIAYTRPHFLKNDWEMYKRVNRIFCDAVLEEIDSEKAIVFVQDYHLALLPRMLKNAMPGIKVMQFWHIPWPNREAFRIFPWGEELLDGLLGNDLLGFHIQHHCNNFLDTVDRGIEAMVDYEHFRIIRGKKPTYVKPFPISIDYERLKNDASLPLVEEKRGRFNKMIKNDESEMKIFVGADRIDYTKGIPERFRGFDLMLRKHPELKTKVGFVQLAAPSRTHVEEYRKLNDDIDSLVDEINWEHQTDDWTPIRFLRAHHDYYAVLAAYQMADVLAVTSLHDGMNLVAKEYVSSCPEDKGMLLLSKYTGAARELDRALLVNPFDIDETSDQMYRAFTMSKEERKIRMDKLKKCVKKNNIYDWGIKIFEALNNIK